MFPIIEVHTHCYFTISLFKVADMSADKNPFYYSMSGNRAEDEVSYSISFFYLYYGW
jgi:hypothetical protein